MAGLDSAAFKKTVDAYQLYCENGKDEQFDKKSEFLSKLENGPFYICRMIGAMEVVIGGITTTRQFQVVAENTREPIPGLYAVGVDGCMLYSDVYTINTPCTCCGNSINSGRTAANHAHEYLASI